MLGKKASMETSLTAKCTRIEPLVNVKGNGFDRFALLGGRGRGVVVRNPPKFGIQVHVYLAGGESDLKVGSGFLSIKHYYYPIRSSLSPWLRLL